MVNSMKNSCQITGLPIISIADGQQVGKVKSLVINPEKGSIDFLTIDHEDFQISVKAIPFKKVVGIGEYAVTVDSESAVIDLNEIPIANQLVNKKIRITNTKVMTRKGELLGEVTEYFADEDTGNILGMEMKLQDKQVALLAEYVLTYGKDIIIVKEDAAGSFLDSIEELDPKARVIDHIEADLEIKDDPFRDVVFVKETATPEVAIEEDQEMLALKEKQVEILKGKRVIKDIYDMNGNILFHINTVLTSDDINKAQEEGPSVVVELSMNVEA